MERAEVKLGVQLPSSLLYADDILIFCKATINNVILLNEIFQLYGNSSGQVVNLSKSRVFYGNQAHEDIKLAFFRLLNFVEGSFPITYLGVLIFIGKPRIMHLQPMAEKILQI